MKYVNNSLKSKHFERPLRFFRGFPAFSVIFWKSENTVAQFWAGCTKYQPEISILDPIREGNGNCKKHIISRPTANSGGVNGQLRRSSRPKSGDLHIHNIRAWIAIPHLGAGEYLQLGTKYIRIFYQVLGTKYLVLATKCLVGVRGCPERDISSLCVMGWGWEMLGNSSAVAAVAAAAAVPPKSGCFCWLPFPSRLGSRMEISGWYSVHPAQNCATVFFIFHQNRENHQKIAGKSISGSKIRQKFILNNFFNVYL